MSIDLTVSIVSHGHGAYLDACLGSIAAARRGLEIEVFVVDNLGGDPAVADVVARHGEATVLASTRPRGFSTNHNDVLRRARGRHAVLLNPDTELRADALALLVDYLDAHPDVGIAGPRLLFPDGTVQPSARRFPGLATVLVRRTPLRLLLGRSRWNARHLRLGDQPTVSGAVDWLLGACLAVPRRFLQEVGLLDEGYFLYVEDIDWARRAWSAGWQVAYVPDAEVVHHHLAQSDRVLLGRASWLHARSMWRYWRKHLAPVPLRIEVATERLPPLSPARSATPDSL